MRNAALRAAFLVLFFSLLKLSLHGRLKKLKVVLHKQGIKWPQSSFLFIIFIRDSMESRFSLILCFHNYWYV